MSKDVDRRARAGELDDFAITPKEDEVPLCDGCRTRGRCRLGVRDVEYVDADEVAVRAICDPGHRGGPTVAHGGWIAAIFDDALTHAVLRENSKVVTRELTVRYRRPVPVSTPLLIVAKVRERDGRVWVVDAQMLADTPPRPVLATASADLVARADDYYERHHRSLENPASPAPPHLSGPARRETHS